MRKCLGIIALRRKDSKFGLICDKRPAAMLPFAGRYRIIDFVLSNMVNNNISTVGVFTGEKTSSIIDHLGSGKPWDLDRIHKGGLRIFTPTMEYGSGSTISGDIHLIHRHRKLLVSSSADSVLLTSGSTISSLNYDEAFDFFKKSDSDVTLLYKKVEGKESYEMEEFVGCDTLQIDDDQNILSIGTNLKASDSINAYIEMFFIKKQVLLDIIDKSIETGKYSFVSDIDLDALKGYKVTAFEMDGYIKVVNTLNNYYNANMEVLDTEIAGDLFYRSGQVLTKVKNQPSSKYENSSDVKDSFVANGCSIKGTVKSSIIFRDINIGEGAVIENSIVMSNSVIGKNAVLRNVITDKNTKIGEGVTLIGTKDDPYVKSGERRF